MNVRSIHEAWPVLPKLVVCNFQCMYVRAPMNVCGVPCDVGLALWHQGIHLWHLSAAQGLQLVGHRLAMDTLAPSQSVRLLRPPPLPVVAKRRSLVPFSHALNRRFPV